MQPLVVWLAKRAFASDLRERSRSHHSFLGALENADAPVGGVCYSLCS
jgi:hypothetical protein